jgi:hypothetical protein
MGMCHFVRVTRIIALSNWQTFSWFTFAENVSHFMPPPERLLTSL